MSFLLRKIKGNPMGVASFIYLLFPIIALFYQDIKGPKVIAVIVIAVFIINYGILILSDVYQFKVKRLIVWMIYLIGTLYFCWAMGSTFIMFFFFGSYVLPYVYEATVKSVESILFYIALLIASGLSLYLLPKALPIVVVLILVVIISLFINFRFIENKKVRAQMKEKNRHINLLIAEQERQRIGQDLHDTLGHVFASLSIKSELASKLIDQNPKKAKEEMLAVNQLSKEALNKVRTIVEHLKFQDFEEEVKSVDQLLKQADITFDFEGQSTARTLNKGQQSILAMLLREAVNNIIKHAHATKVTGTLKEAQHIITLIISDNGKGISKPEATLHSIRERAALLDGEVTIKSEQGVTLMIRIPRGDNL
ncbi:sensor histidine kinase [Staphylococcus simulans]|uniref:sensor histidine kinase n=2 Tax=Staphylococcus TaxID=1279 RepID=UPI0008A4DCFD|nr:sensor histidine kinase [Staphylococcus simulans]